MVGPFAVSEGRAPVGAQAKEIPPARDLADFHLRWQQFRPAALVVLTDYALSQPQADCLVHLIELADRVSVEDLLGSGEDDISGPA